MDTENLEGTTLMAMKYDFGWLDTADSLTSKVELVVSEATSDDKVEGQTPTSINDTVKIEETSDDVEETVESEATSDDKVEGQPPTSINETVKIEATSDEATSDNKVEETVESQATSDDKVEGQTSTSINETVKIEATSDEATSDDKVEGQTPTKTIVTLKNGKKAIVTSKNDRFLKCKVINDLSHIMVGGKIWIAHKIVGEVKWYLANTGNNDVDYQKIDAAIKGKIMLSVNLALHTGKKKAAHLENMGTAGIAIMVNRTRNDCLVIVVGKIATSPHFFYYSSTCSGAYFGSESVKGYFDGMQKTDCREKAEKEALLAMCAAARDDLATGGFCTMFLGSDTDKHKCIVAEPFEILQARLQGK